MPNLIKKEFLEELAKRFGAPRKLPGSESLFEVGSNAVRLYFRYSKRHPDNRTFFGIRKIDLQCLEGHPALLCFAWDGQREPLFVPFHEFEEIFAGLTPASDGQFKAQVFETQETTELYIANAGRFNVEGFMGWRVLEDFVQSSGLRVPELSHSQVQTLLGGIGFVKGFDIWIPSNDRLSLDRNLVPTLQLARELPSALAPIRNIAEEVDVIWLERGSGLPLAFYEVEHSTPIYSGLLRFNDVHLIFQKNTLRFGIVATHDRRSLFVRQLERPTFKASGLREVCTFLEYDNVYGWHQRMKEGGQQNEKKQTA